VDTDESPFASDRPQIEAWIEQAKNGSSAALGELLRTCQTYLFDLAHKGVSPELKCKVSASDLVQETSLDAHRDFADFRGQCLEELLAWLRRILLYNAANARRRYEATGKRQLSRELPLEVFTGVGGQLQDSALSPRSLLASIEEQQAVESALSRMSEDHKTVILLRSREHLSFVEIGESMDRTADAARKLWFRAVERLQHELNRGQ
jgi:RNA polymerase sigma-70 factor, ECF subfamily